MQKKEYHIRIIIDGKLSYEGKKEATIFTLDEETEILKHLEEITS